MSFISDLIAWKKRSEVEFDLVDGSEEPFDNEAYAETYDSLEEDIEDDESADADFDEYQEEDADLNQFMLADKPQDKPVEQPNLSAVQALAASNPIEDDADGDPEDILARVAMLAAPKPEPKGEPRTRPVITAVPRPVASSGAKIWDLKSGSSAPKAKPVVSADMVAKPPVVQAVNGATYDPIDLPATQATGASTARTGGRVKTRLLGFHNPGADGPDIFDTAPTPNSAKGPAFPTGWLVVVKGPGKGSSFALGSGVNQIGRGEDQTVSLDFGDMSISRNNHAAVAYDEETDKFFLGHGGKSNLVRLNDRPVLSTESLASRDLIRIGETTLCFVAFCAEGFSWT